MQPERTIWYIVGDLTQPGAEPFVLMKVDTSIKREEAERLAHEFNNGPLN